jgi:hypothetical protein
MLDQKPIRFQPRTPSTISLSIYPENLGSMWLLQLCRTEHTTESPLLSSRNFT